VALTRARRGIIVIGSKDTLMKDARWSKWLSWVEKNQLEKSIEESITEPNNDFELNQESEESNDL
jgi:superfamily I DNA and/or RNA helicase